MTTIFLQIKNWELEGKIYWMALRASGGLKIAVPLKDSLLIVSSSIWKLQCVIIFPQRFFKISKITKWITHPETGVWWSVDEWGFLCSLELRTFSPVHSPPGPGFSFHSWAAECPGHLLRSMATAWSHE